jgi:hypothetical protein
VACGWREDWALVRVLRRWQKVRLRLETFCGGGVLEVLKLEVGGGRPRRIWVEEERTKVWGME